MDTIAYWCGLGLLVLASQGRLSQQAIVALMVVGASLCVAGVIAGTL